MAIFHCHASLLEVKLEVKLEGRKRKAWVKLGYQSQLACSVVSPVDSQLKVKGTYKTPK